jgi:hypothetical protein
MCKIIHFPISSALQAGFIQLDENGYHYLYVRHMINRCSEVHFQTPDDERSYSATLTKRTALDKPDPNVIDDNTGLPLHRYRIGVYGSVNVERLFIGMALVGKDVKLAQVASHKIAAHNDSGVMILSLGMSERGLHLRSHDSEIHFVYNIKTFDSFAK